MADFLTSTDGIINGAIAKSWKIVLTSSNGTLKLVNFEPGDLLTLVVQEDASGSNYTLTFPSSVLWQAKAAPNRDTTANAVAVYTFSYDGTNFRDASGGASKLPARIGFAGLGVLVGAGVVALTLVSSNGNNGRPQAGSSDIQQYCTGSSCTLGVKVGKVTASGSQVIGATGSLVVGSMTLDERGSDAKLIIKRTGQVIAKSTISGTTLTQNIAAAAAGRPTCFNTGGTLSYCQATANGTGCGCK